MDWSKIVTEQTVHIVILGIFSLISFLLRNALLGPIRELNDKVLQITKIITDHVVECHQVPKSLILERINNLDKNFEEFKDDAKDERRQQRKDRRDDPRRFPD